MKLLAEFEPSRALRIVRETWEDAAYDDMEEIKEAAVEPIREEADEVGGPLCSVRRQH